MKISIDISAICSIGFLIALYLPSKSIGQEINAELELKKAGYSLSVSSSRLNVIRTDLLKIEQKNILLDGSDKPQQIYVALLIENILMIETICTYEALLLRTLDSIEGKNKNEQYDFHHSRLKKSTLKRLYLTNRSIQSNIDNIDNKEISVLAMVAKEELVKVQKRIEEVISTLQLQTRSTP
jgi:hypothetical protein